MADFIRKKRFIKYSDKECKKFLSRDFMKQCAYCRIREGDLGGPDDFEMDHFLPVSKGGSDMYENLYYTCTTCNGKSGKSDVWSETLLDPCKDDIFGVHISLLSDFTLKDITSQGEEYIKSLKLNRKSYVNKRKVLELHKKELRIKLLEYKELYAKALSGGFIGSPQFFAEDIAETEAMLQYGANYRLSKYCFDEENDELIYQLLSNVGNVICIDEDYDLFYKLEVCGKSYLCCAEIDDWSFDSTEKVRRYISIEKINVWREIQKETPIIIVTLNVNEKKLYYTSFKSILESKGAQNPEKCAYYICIDNSLEI